MSLPRTVQQQIDAANRHFQPVENPEDAAPASAKPPAQEGNENLSSGHDSSPQDQAPDPDSRQEPQSKPQDDTDATYWRHRHNVAEGRLRVANDENRTLKEKAATLEKRVEELEKASRAGDSAQQGSLTAQDVNALERLKDEYGDDMVNMVKTAFEHLMQGQPQDKGDPEQAARLTEIQERLDREDQERQADREARFWTRLQQRVPNFQTINGEQAFLDWLGGYDRLRGVERQQLLHEAQQSLDGDRVADIFDEYLQQVKPPQSNSPAEGVPEDQVQPRQSRSTQPPSGQRVWSGAEITQFYRDRAAGKYSDEEGKRLEADIFSAQQQGRVR
nr:hypothetical protein [uncultured Halomonas sp.]